MTKGISIVGLRPALPEEVAAYTDCQRQRLLVKSGITCCWQTCRNRDSITFDEWVDLDLCYKDAYQWVINGKRIVSDPKDLDLDVDIFQEPGGPYGIDEDVVRLVFYPNGALPGPIQLRFKSDYLYTYAGIEGELHLYYIDGDEYIEEDGDIDLVFDGTDKWCYATFTHNSEFLVSPAELSSAAGAGHGQSVKPLGTGAGGDAALADTGDAAGAAAGACLAGAAIAACGIAFAASRRRRSE